MEALVVSLREEKGREAQAAEVQERQRSEQEYTRLHPRPTRKFVRSEIKRVTAAGSRRRDEVALLTPKVLAPQHDSW